MAKTDGGLANPGDLKAEFNKASQNHNTGQGISENSSGVATAAEKALLEKQRAKPKLEMHNTIGGSIEQEVHTQVEKQREERIDHLQDRLQSAQQKFRSDFRKNARERLKARFNRASHGRSR